MTTETILSILGNLEKLHKSLLRISKEKSELIKNGDINGIDELLKDEQAHLAAIVQMDQSRQNAVSAYLKGNSISVPMNPTITNLIEVTPVPEKEQLTEARDRLLHAIHELKWQNDLNQKLTYQSLQFVNLSLDMVRPRTESVTYSKSGINGKKATGTGTIPNFDSQA
ncbi:flagellar protein FlgN [Sporosarcina highlanderae]|uniref:Flagellar protein FlgN n=1 Tax=Sporosarcina highlanderae TaxID=3035916 RepID=A0ABT8JNS1_9BACL|nr:flagellar protein FlgN [Sporosarcina highlanderae]MDN4606790.1 flagellar protein FlgN [Sporosarcina highlanderae]